MDQTLSLKLAEFSKALATLKEALDMFDLKNILVRDATIKRFEYSYELCWKTSKVFLKESKGEMVIGPKECFKTLGKHGFLSSEEIEKLLAMVDDRNETTHAYGEKFVQALYPRIKEYYGLMGKVHGGISR
ncbi:MAG: HI0074 family nucleotidyltransferase substrate-binding subunit [Candidatus Peregrinibacteria bacterium]|nr:HI0074 family nucleotidyltransferase substrate-binding subunit [Candidatus Peregrinibacteria bacterium]